MSATTKTTPGKVMISERHLRMLARAVSKLPRVVEPHAFFRKGERVRYTFYLFDWLRDRPDLAGTRWERWQIQILAEQLQRHWQHGEWDFPAFVKWLLKRELER